MPNDVTLFWTVLEQWRILSIKERSFTKTAKLLYIQ